MHPDHLTDPLLCQWRDGQMVPEGAARAHTHSRMHAICGLAYRGREAKQRQTKKCKDKER